MSSAIKISVIIELVNNDPQLGTKTNILLDPDVQRYYFTIQTVRNVRYFLPLKIDLKR